MAYTTSVVDDVILYLEIWHSIKVCPSGSGMAFYKTKVWSLFRLLYDGCGKTNAK